MKKKKQTNLCLGFENKLNQIRNWEVNMGLKESARATAGITTPHVTQAYAKSNE